MSAEYGLLAESVSHPRRFLERAPIACAPRRKWHDGKPVTAEDVIFSVRGVQEAPSACSRPTIGHVTKAEKTGERDVTFTFDRPAIANCPQIVGQLNVLPKHWWEGTDASGHKRDIAPPRLEPPLGCGAYRIKELRGRPHRGLRAGEGLLGQRPQRQCRARQFRRDPLRVFPRPRRSRWKPSRPTSVDWRTENSAKNWATAYDFPRCADKRVMLEEFPIATVGVMQAFAFNTRRDKFKDPRVRRAFNFAFDFEEMNKQIFFGQYKRINSYFEGTELASSGLPQGRNSKSCETVRDKVPPEVFTTAYPQSGRRQRRRPCAPTCARRCGSPGGGLRGARPQADQRQDRRAADGRGPASTAIRRFERVVAVLQAVAGSSRHRRRRSAQRRRRRNTRTACAAGTST